MKDNLRRLYILRPLLIFLGLCFYLNNVLGQDEKFKALFIYNFTKYIDWPGISGNDFKITVLGNTGLVVEMKGIASKMKVEQRSIVVNSAKSINDIADCQILYISKNNSADIPKLFSKCKNNNILIITESANACSEGSSINFSTTKNGTLSFEISRNNMVASGLKISAKLFGLGKVVD